MRGELARAAMALFVERGFDETTVDDIVQAAGVGRRTFFRYFESKEAVVLLPSEGFGGAVARSIAEQPKADPPLRALEKALAAGLAGYGLDPRKTRTRHRLVEGHPVLRARHLEQQEQWCPLFASALAARMGVKANALEPELLARLGLLAFRTTMARWTPDPRAKMGSMLEDIFAVLRETLRAPMKRR